MSFNTIPYTSFSHATVAVKHDPTPHLSNYRFHMKSVLAERATLVR